MRLRKDDPIYYRNKVNELIEEALREGFKLDIAVNKDRLSLLFKADNRDKVEVILVSEK